MSPDTGAAEAGCFASPASLGSGCGGVETVPTILRVAGRGDGPGPEGVLRRYAHRHDGDSGVYRVTLVHIAFGAVAPDVGRRVCT